MGMYNSLQKQYLPKLNEHFKLCQIEESQYIIDWYLTLFSKPLIIPVSSIIWDCFLFEGPIFIHLITLAILKLYESRLLKFNFEECLDFLHKLPEDVDIFDLLKMVENFVVPTKVLEELNLMETKVM